MNNEKQPKIDVSDYIKKRNEVLQDLKTMPEVKNMSWETYQKWKRSKQLNQKP